MTETAASLLPASLPARLAAEAAGTFALVLVGTGAIACAEVNGSISHLGISLAFGAVVAAMILAFGRISGAHINPAVTLGLALARRLERRVIAPYVAAQLLGALAASAVVRGLYVESASLGATRPVAGWWPSFALETAQTCVLMFVILRASSHPRARLPVVALLVGAVVGLAAFSCGPLTGASMNPARSFGPALVSGSLTALPLYFAAPALGALLAVRLCRLRGSEACCPSGNACP